MRRKKKKKQQQQKTEISINKEPKLRIHSEITVIIKYSRQKAKRGYELFDTFN